MKNFIKKLKGDYAVWNGYSEFENGYRVYDKDVCKVVKKRTSLFERLFRLDSVVSKTLVAHTELCCKVQDK